MPIRTVFIVLTAIAIGAGLFLMLEP